MYGVFCVAAGAGIASATLALAARRAPLLGWIVLSPLGMAVATCGGWAAIAGVFTGSALHGAVTMTQPARLRPLGFVFGGLGWGLTAWAAGLLLDALRTPRLVSEGVALACILPLIALLATLPMRLAGAPRWIHAALACTQEPWPVVIRTGYYGGDATVSMLLGLSASVPCLLALPAAAPVVAVLIVALLFAALAAATRSLSRTRHAIEQLPRVRIAAVAANGAAPTDAPADGLWPLRSPEYRDVEATVARYEQHVARAAREGAELVVLPEVAVVAEGAGVARWFDAAGRWASELGVTLVAPHFDPVTPTNTLTVVEPSGRLWSYDKQHPAPGLEPAPRQRQTAGPYHLERGFPISTAICVDLDYADLIAPVRAAGGLLVVPANDWLGFEETHDRSAVWAAVLSETTVLRSTGHGICSARDGAGRLLASASSLDGATVLVVDAPLRWPR